MKATTHSATARARTPGGLAAYRIAGVWYIVDRRGVLKRWPFKVADVRRVSPFTH